MKRNALLVLAILTATGLLAGRADAASAVAIDPYGHLTRAYDPFATEEAAKQRALELAVHHGWLGARIGGQIFCLPSVTRFIERIVVAEPLA